MIEKNLDEILTYWYNSLDYIILSLLKYCYNNIDVWLPDIIRISRPQNIEIPVIEMIIEAVKRYEIIKPTITQILLSYTTEE